MPPSSERLPDQYPPSAYSNDQTILRRLRFQPDPALYGTEPYPVAITSHAGGFRSGDAYGSTSQRQADRDLAAAGFLVFSIDYRLAPEGLILHQHVHDGTPEGIASGRPPQQSNDVKQQILAAKYDPKSNGIVFLIGGSGGATHGLWAALDPNPTVPGWSAAEFPKAIVALSAPCDLSSRVGDNQHDVQIFGMDVENYTNSTDRGYQYSVSPIALVAAATNIPPIRLYATQMDPVPHQQAEAMRDALFDHGGVDVLEWTIPGINLHAFNYWHTLNPLTGNYVSVEVIDFLRSQLP
jgi:acetyl esterase/lipase